MPRGTKLKAEGIGRVTVILFVVVVVKVALSPVLAFELSADFDKCWQPVEKARSRIKRDVAFR